MSALAEKEKAVLRELDADADGIVSDDELRAYLSRQEGVGQGTAKVRVQGVVLHKPDVSKPYTGINGDYVRTEDVCNGRAIYGKERAHGTVMWWANINGGMNWCVGPRSASTQESSREIWASVVCLGPSPDYAGTRPWSVYSYKSHEWEMQSAVEVLGCDVVDPPTPIDLRAPSQPPRTPLVDFPSDPASTTRLSTPVLVAGASAQHASLAADAAAAQRAAAEARLEFEAREREYAAMQELHLRQQRERAAKLAAYRAETDRLQQIHCDLDAHAQQLQVEAAAAEAAAEKDRLAEEARLAAEEARREEEARIAADEAQRRLALKCYQVQTRIGAQGAIEIAGALRGGADWLQLRLGEAAIGDDGATMLAAALHDNTRLQQLELEYNLIGDAGAQRLAAALEANNTLTSLGLEGNQISDVGLSAVSGALQINTSLLELDLKWNAIRGPSGVKQLAGALAGNTTLSHLDLSCNDFGETGVAIIVDALRRNVGLKKLVIGEKEAGIGDECATTVSDALKENTTLKQLHLKFDRIGHDDHGEEVGAAIQACGILTEQSAKSLADALVLGAEERRVRESSEEWLRQQELERNRLQRELDARLAAEAEEARLAELARRAAEEERMRLKALAEKECQWRSDNGVIYRPPPSDAAHGPSSDFFYDLVLKAWTKKKSNSASPLDASSSSLDHKPPPVPSPKRSVTQLVAAPRWSDSSDRAIVEDTLLTATQGGEMGYRCAEGRGELAAPVEQSASWHIKVVSLGSNNGKIFVGLETVDTKGQQLRDSEDNLIHIGTNWYTEECVQSVMFYSSDGDICRGNKVIVETGVCFGSGDVVGMQISESKLQFLKNGDPVGEPIAGLKKLAWAAVQMHRPGDKVLLLRELAGPAADKDIERTRVLKEEKRRAAEADELRREAMRLENLRLEEEEQRRKEAREAEAAAAEVRRQEELQEQRRRDEERDRQNAAEAAAKKARQEDEKKRLLELKQAKQARDEAARKIAAQEQIKKVARSRGGNYVETPDPDTPDEAEVS